MDLYKTVSEFIKNVSPIDEEYLRGLGTPLYMQEFRTYNIGVPRRSGKTTTVNRLSKELSALTYYKYPLVTNACKHGAKIQDGYPLRGYWLKGLKCQCILLDEYRVVPDEVYDIVYELRRHENITHDFFILGLYTP